MTTMSRLQQGDVVVFDTPYGWVGTVAQYDRDLPRGAMLVHPGPWLAVSQAEADHTTGQGRTFDYTIQLVTKACGEPDENNPEGVRSSASREWLFVQDIHAPVGYDHHNQTRNGAGFYAYSVPTLMHRVVETDSRELAEVIVEHDPEGSTLDDVLVERRVRAA